MKTYKIYFLTILFLFLTTGCSKDSVSNTETPTPSPEIPEPKPNNDIILSEKTILLTEDFIKHVTEPITGMDIKLDASIKKTDLPKKGEILLCSTISDQFPFGFLGKVTEVNKSENIYMIKTEYAALNEAFDKLHINETQSFILDNTDVKGRSIAESPTLIPYKYEGFTGFQFVKDRNFSTELNSNGWKDIDLSGSIEGDMNIKCGIGFKLECNIDLDKEKDKNYIVITLHSHSSQDITFNILGNANLESVLEFKRFPIKILKFPEDAIVQFILRPEIILSAYANISGKFETNYTLHNEQDWMLFFEHKDEKTSTGIAKLENGKNNNASSSFVLDGKLGAGVRMEFSLTPFTFTQEKMTASASLSFGPSISAEIPLSNNSENYYNAFRDNKIQTVGLNIEGKATCTIPLSGKDNTEVSLLNLELFKKEYYLFPLFENLKWDKKTSTISSVVKRELLIPAYLDYALFDRDKKFLNLLLDQPIEYKNEESITNPFTTANKNINSNQTYYICPIVELPILGKIKAMPEIKLETIAVETVDAAYFDKTLTMVGKFNPQISNISSFGICYSTVNNSPTLADNHTKALMQDDGEFQISLSGVKEGDTYYYRAYIIYDGEIYLANNIKKIKIKDSNNSLIIGKWKFIESKSTSTCDDPGYTEWPWGDLTINSDGTFHASDGYLLAIDGTWYFTSENKLVIKYYDEELLGLGVNITNLSSQTLSFTSKTTSSEEECITRMDVTFERIKDE